MADTGRTAEPDGGRPKRHGSRAYHIRRIFACEGPVFDEVSSAERQCCLFLRFQLTVEETGAPVVLDVTGSAGSQEFVLAILELE